MLFKAFRRRELQREVLEWPKLSDRVKLLFRKTDLHMKPIQPGRGNLNKDLQSLVQLRQMYLNRILILIQPHCI